MKELAGTISVDSGMVVIGDPSYLKRPEVAAGLQAAMTGGRIVEGAEPIVGGKSDMTLGVLLRTYWGDGCYPVSVWVETDPRARGKRVRRVTIEFDPE